MRIYSMIVAACLMAALPVLAGETKGEPMKVKVAAIRVVWGQGRNEPPGRTVQRGLLMAEEAAEKGAKYIVLPENFLHSNNPADQQIPGRLTDLVVDVARKNNVYICAGIVESRKSSFRESWDKFLSAVVVGPEGVLSVHRKVDIVISPQARAWKEGSPRTDCGAWAGRDFEMHSMGEIERVGIMICRDSATGWAWGRLLSQDPRIIFQPNLRSSIMKYGADLPAMAKRYAVPIVAPCGHPESESLIVDRDGTIVDMEAEKERVLLGEVTLADEHPEYMVFEVLQNRPQGRARETGARE